MLSSDVAVTVIGVAVTGIGGVAGTGIAILLRTNIGVHQPPPRQRRRTNVTWGLVTVLSMGVLAVVLPVLP